MSLHGNIRARLLEWPGLTALVSTRIYTLRLPQAAVMPAVTFQRVSGRQLGSMRRGTDLTAPRWQFTAWGTDYNSATDVREETRLALDGWSDLTPGIDHVRAVVLAGEGEQFDTESERYMATLDAILWATQSVPA
jgi:Protein of unknown function (DUF3168)